MYLLLMEAALKMRTSSVTPKPVEATRKLFILLIFVVMGAALARSQTGGSQQASPRKLLDRFCRMDLEGKQLGPEAQHRTIDRTVTLTSPVHNNVQSDCQSIWRRLIAVWVYQVLNIWLQEESWLEGQP
jgi:hypothetical protein